MARSEIVSVTSDHHFPFHDKPSWRAFRKWHRHTTPDISILNGDLVDFGMLSRYSQGANDPVHAVDQIKCMVTEVNSMIKECGQLVIIEGNHDERWSRVLMGEKAHVFKDAKGLSFKEQCLQQGLNPGVKWVRESTHCRGYKVGSVLFRHAHKQSSKFGGGKHVAASRLEKSMGQSEVFGHFHRGQIYFQSAGGKTSFAIANPCMTIDHEYAPDANWQRGFSILEFANQRKIVTPSVVVIQKGVFCRDGIVYDGNVRR